MTTPKCACGCGLRARLVADVLVDGGLDCRQPWDSTLHALGACDDEARVSVDVVVTAVDLPAIIAARPCWCGLREHATCDWCPRHGLVGARVRDPLDRSLAVTQPMPVVTDAEAVADLDSRGALSAYERQARIGRELDRRLASGRGAR